MRRTILTVALSITIHGALASGDPSSDLLFTSNHEGNSELYLLRAGETKWINLTQHPAPDNWGVWSPDGRYIVFQTRRHGALDLYRMNADGSQPVRLTDNDAHDYLPSWTPDGTHITFLSWRLEAGDEESATHFYQMTADGEKQQRLMPTSPGTSTDLRWLNNGRQFVFARKRNDGGSDLILHNVGTGTSTQLTDNPLYEGSASVTDDDKTLLFYASDDNGARIDLIELATGQRRTLVDDGWDWYPRVHGNGPWVTFSRTLGSQDDNDLDIYAVRMDGAVKPVALVSGPGRQSESQWRPVIGEAQSQETTQENGQEPRVPEPRR